MFREARARHGGDPVAAWAEITGNPEFAARYKSARGTGGFVRASWDEAVELAAAAYVHTIRTRGPDRIAAFSPIPAMSMVSHAAGARFHTLIGAPLLSFYDWYADLPVASPQVFGDQTDVPESGDWWDASYLMLWGSNVPVTRTPDAHWMAEARYRGQKVVVCSPDCSDAAKFADEWLSPAPGTDGALAMAMGHVILREFLVDRQVPYFADYLTRFTDAPFLVVLEPEQEAFRPGKFLTADALGEDSEHADFKPVLLDGRTGQPAVPGGSLGFRFGEAGLGRWNLDLGDIVPVLTLQAPEAERVAVDLPLFDADDGTAGMLRRGVPARRIAGRLVTTVFDLLLAQYGVGRDDLPGDWPSSFADAEQPCTPAWQEAITGVPRPLHDHHGRRDQSLLPLRHDLPGVPGAGDDDRLPGPQWRRLGALRGPGEGAPGHRSRHAGHGGGLAAAAAADDRDRVLVPGHRPVALRHVRGRRVRVAAGQGRFAGMATADLLAQSARLGWMPSYPTFNWNPLDLADAAERSGEDPGAFVTSELDAGRLRFAAEDPDAPENFLKHLLGASSSVRAQEAPEGQRPRDVTWREEAPEGKLDLLLALDFRMTSTTLFADVVLPAATWYEKHDLSSTDMHPFVHAFNPAISPPWQTRSDFDAFHALARAFSELAATHLGRRRDLMARSAGRAARPDHQGRHVRAGTRGGVPQGQERDRPGRGRGRAAPAGS